MQFVFGSGLLFVQPQGFDNQAANTPLRVGALQGVSVDFGFTTKELSAGKWPIAIGRGTGKIPCKANWAAFSAGGFNAVFFGGPDPDVGRTCIAVDEQHTVAANAVTPNHAGAFLMDFGVVATLPSGATYERVASAPSGRQYTCNESSGAYGFGGVDGAPVLVSYAYADAANGRTIDLPNRPIGHTPRFSVVLTETFNGKVLTLTLTTCVAGKMGFTSKLADFVIPQFDFSASADDSGLVGTLSVEEGASDDDYALGMDLLLHFDEADPLQWRDYSRHGHPLTLFPNAGAISGQDTGSLFPLGGDFAQAFGGDRTAGHYGSHSWLSARGGFDFGASDFFIEFSCLRRATSAMFGWAVLDNLLVGDGGWYVWFIPLSGDPSNQQLVFSSESDDGILTAKEIRIENTEADIGTRVRYAFSRKGRTLSSFRDGVLAETDSARFDPAEGIAPCPRGFLRIGCSHQTEPQLIDGFDGVIDELIIGHGPGWGIDASYTPTTAPYLNP